MPTTYKRSLVFTSACAGLLIFGIVMTVLGAILPSLMDRYDISKAGAGSLFLLMSFGIMVGSVIFGPVVDRFGYKYLLMAGIALVVVGLEGIAFVNDFNLLRAAVFMVGIGGGSINGLGNALVANITPEGRTAGLSLLGIFFGIGAFGVPFILGSLEGKWTYAAIVSMVGMIIVAPMGYVALIRFPAPKQPHGFPLKEGVRLLRQKVLLLLGFILFFESGMEIMIGGWSAAFFDEELVLGNGQAVIFLSFYWLGMMSARLVLGFILRWVPPAAVLRISLLIAFTGALMMFVAQGPAVAVIGLILVGIGFGAGFPVVLGFIGDLFPDLSGTAFSVALIIALTGGMLLPWLAGIIGEAADLRYAILIVPGSIIIMQILIGIVLGKFQKPEKSAPRRESI